MLLGSFSGVTRTRTAPPPRIRKPTLHLNDAWTGPSIETEQAWSAARALAPANETARASAVANALRMSISILHEKVEPREDYCSAAQTPERQLAAE